MDHVITVESTQVYRGDVPPNQAPFLTSDGERFSRTMQRKVERQGVELEFQKETKRTYECSCGRRFRKPETARAHLEETDT